MFSLEGVSRTNGVFLKTKLEWFNTPYLQKLPIEYCSRKSRKS